MMTQLEWILMINANNTNLSPSLGYNNHLLVTENIIKRAILMVNIFKTLFSK